MMMSGDLSSSTSPYIDLQHHHHQQQSISTPSLNPSTHQLHYPPPPGPLAPLPPMRAPNNTGNLDHESNILIDDVELQKATTSRSTLITNNNTDIKLRTHGIRNNLPRSNNSNNNNVYREAHMNISCPSFKLEKSRQSARECRARKKLRYEYLEELVADREKAIITLQQELSQLKDLCEQIDAGHINENLRNEIASWKCSLQQIGNISAHASSSPTSP